MTEGVESEPAVICTHTTFAYAAKWQIRSADVHDCAVDAHASARGAVDHPLVLGQLLAEGIERERLGVRPHEGDCFVE